MFKICKKKTISEIRFSVEKYYQGCYKAKGMTLSVIWIKIYKCSGIHQPFIGGKTISSRILDTKTFLLDLRNKIISGTYIRWKSSKGVHNFCGSPLLLIQALEHHEKCACYKMQELGEY